MNNVDKQQLIDKGREVLKTLCLDIGERPVGSEGNRRASAYINDQLRSLGWETETPGFDAIDWIDEGACLSCDNESFNVQASPYSKGFKGEAVLVCASAIDELESAEARDKILLLYGSLASEQLMPKNFVFYNPDSHKRIISVLENSGAKAIICATSRNPALAGGVYPFPLIEDGDFDIPSVFMTDEDGERLRKYSGKTVMLESISGRIPAKAYNVIARKGNSNGKRIVVTAHLDAKKGTPGAIDNATGIAVLILVADLLRDYTGNLLLELVAFNGEDYYAVPGQMDYIAANTEKFDTILLNINIDGAGYHKGPSAISYYGLPVELSNPVKEIIRNSDFIIEGQQWPQGDHSIFIQLGVPAIAVTSLWFSENMDNQDITHTPKDNIDIVAADRVAEIALVLASMVVSLDFSATGASNSVNYSETTSDPFN